jgi:L-ascorbate metabolism protein UlaG (beta-lactamase superfamily)
MTSWTVRTAALAAAALFISSLALAQPKAAPAKRTTATWWGHAAWVLETPGGARIAIDPWLGNPLAPKEKPWPEALDAILVTHAHNDHVGDAAELAKRTGAKVYGSFELVSLLGAKDGVGANIGGTFQVKDVTFHLVEAVHSSGFGQDPKGPIYGGPAMGFVLQIAGGPTVYHAGDTNYFASMQLLAEQFRPTVALLPIGGHFTMGPSEAAIAARLLKVGTVVPMHFGTFPLLTGTPEALEAELKKAKVRAKVLAIKPGESLQL